MTVNELIAELNKVEEEDINNVVRTGDGCDIEIYYYRQWGDICIATVQPEEPKDDNV